MGAAAALPGRWRVFPSRSAVALRAEPPGSPPINQKAAADFARCGFSFTTAERIRRAAGEIGDQACRCFIVAFCVLYIPICLFMYLLSVLYFIYRLFTAVRQPNRLIFTKKSCLFPIKGDPGSTPTCLPSHLRSGTPLPYPFTAGFALLFKRVLYYFI